MLRREREASPSYLAAEVKPAVVIACVLSRHPIKDRFASHCTVIVMSGATLTRQQRESSLPREEMALAVDTLLHQVGGRVCAGEGA